MKKYLPVLALFLFFYSFAGAATPPDSTDGQIRAVFCRIENGDYAAAQLELEKILQREPANIYAQRLLPGVLARQIKDDDKSPQNIARIRKTIEAFREYLKRPQLSAEEKTAADDFVIGLYEKLGEAEKSAELLKRLDDKNYGAKDRSRFYARLADQPRRCAEQAVNFSPPTPKAPEKSEIEKAKACVVKGLEYVKQAIALDADSEPAWLSRVSLLDSASKIAALENDQAQKTLLKKQSVEAFRRWKLLSDKRFNQMPKIPAAELAKNDEFTAETLSRELIEYKAQKPLDSVVGEIYVPSALETLVPPSVVDESSREDDAATVDKNANRKREWKQFSSEDNELTAELPGEVETERYGVFSETSERYETFRKNLKNWKGKAAPTNSEAAGETVIHTARSEGIKYMILSQPKPSFQDAALDDAALNALAWAFAGPTSNLWNRTAGDSAEFKLFKKENVGDRPGRFYTYVLRSCSEKNDGSFITLIGKTRNYVVDIQGAAFSDGRVQRFVKSLRITERK